MDCRFFSNRKIESSPFQIPCSCSDGFIIPPEPSGDAPPEKLPECSAPSPSMLLLPPPASGDAGRFAGLPGFPLPPVGLLLLLLLPPPLLLLPHEQLALLLPPSPSGLGEAPAGSGEGGTFCCCFV